MSEEQAFTIVLHRLWIGFLYTIPWFFLLLAGVRMKDSEATYGGYTLFAIGTIGYVMAVNL